MDTILGLGRSAGEAAGPAAAPWWLSGRAGAEAEARTVGRRRASDPPPAVDGRPGGGTVRAIAPPGAREGRGAPDAAFRPG
jgi:hypothetical protein